MELKLIRQVNALKLCVVCLILMNLMMLFSSFADKTKKVSFEEIDAQRINIIGTTGKPVMSISNRRLIPGPSMNGKIYPKEYADSRELFSGIIFFNEQGDEVGGLIYNGFPKDSGYYAMEHLSFDQWKHNQVVAMQYIDNGKSRRAGLRVWDRPTNASLDQIFDRFKARNGVSKSSAAYDSITNEIKASAGRGDNGVERMFIGSQDEVAQVQLRDKQGRVRARFFVDKSGEARLEFFDSTGSVKNTFPN